MNIYHRRDYQSLISSVYRRALYFLVLIAIRDECKQVAIFERKPHYTDPNLFLKPNLNLPVNKFTWMFFGNLEPLRLGVSQSI